LPAFEYDTVSNYFFDYFFDYFPDYLFPLPTNALSIMSPIGCQVPPSNCTSRICLIGRKSSGPVLIAMPGSRI